MPIALTVSGYTESGHEYDDLLGVYYSFPASYRNLIVPGETAVFYTGSRSYPDKAPLSYLGLAVVGDIVEIPSEGTRLQMRCSFHLYKEFEQEVPFKTEDQYLESAANQHKKPSLYFSNGVRRITMGDLHTILTAASQLAENGR